MVTFSNAPSLPTTPSAPRVLGKLSTEDLFAARAESGNFRRARPKPRHESTVESTPVGRIVKSAFAAPTAPRVLGVLTRDQLAAAQATSGTFRGAPKKIRTPRDTSMDLNVTPTPTREELEEQRSLADSLELHRTFRTTGTGGAEAAQANRLRKGDRR